MILGINGIISGKGASPLMSGLISMYKAESNELDSYGTNNGSPFGGLLYVTGKQGNGFRFNGSNSYVQLPNNAFSIQDFSISLWLNPASFSVDRTIFSNSNGNNTTIATGYWLGISSGGILQLYIYSGGSALTVYSYNTLTVNTWYNITLTKTQNNQPIMYVNGSVVTPTITNYGGGSINPVYSSGSYTYSTPCIGAYMYNNASSKDLYGNSTTDEIGIWNRALTPIQVTELYGCGIGKFYPFITAPTIDSDACAFITAASITDNTQVNAVNQLVLDLKSANIWSKFKAIYPFVGGTASQHRFNLKDPRTVSAAFYIDFYGGVTHSSNGVQFDGATGYANTKLIPSSVYGTQNPLLHYSVCNRTNLTITSSIWADGVYSSTGIGGICYMQNSFTTLAPGNSAVMIGSSDPGGTLTGFSSNTDGYFIFSRTSNTSLKAYRNGTLIGAKTTDIGSDTYIPRAEFLLGARNDSYDLTLRPSSYNPFEKTFATIGTALTDTEATALRNAVVTYNTTLNRQ